VTVAAAKLEILVGQVVAAALDPAYSTHFGAVAGQPSRAMRELRELAKGASDDQLKRLHNDAKALFEERNTVVHALVAIDYAPADGSPGPAWILYHPRSGKDLPMPSLDEMEALAKRFNDLSTLANRLAGEELDKRLRQSAADSVRTDESK
jgi:hypothetical protein